MFYRLEKPPETLPRPLFSLNILAVGRLEQCLAR